MAEGFDYCVPVLKSHSCQSMRKPRPGEYTCNCDAYKFPHRFGGGKCTREEYATQYWETFQGAGDCFRCKCFNDQEHYCEVAQGQENASECEALQNLIRLFEIK